MDVLVLPVYKILCIAYAHPRPNVSIDAISPRGIGGKTITVTRDATRHDDHSKSPGNPARIKLFE
jgi:hypothetical protein